MGYLSSAQDTIFSLVPPSAITSNRLRVERILLLVYLRALHIYQKVKIYGIFYICPVSVGVDSQTWYHYIHYIKISVMMGFWIRWPSNIGMAKKYKTFTTNLIRQGLISWDDQEMIIAELGGSGGIKFVRNLKKAQEAASDKSPRISPCLLVWKKKEKTVRSCSILLMWFGVYSKLWRPDFFVPGFCK